MIELGKTQELEIVRTKEFGVYLSEKAGDEVAVLLPKKQVPAGAKIGDKVKAKRKNFFEEETCLIRRYVVKIFFRTCIF